MHKEKQEVNRMKGFTNYLRRNGFWLACNVAALLPLAWLVWGFTQESLGVDPINTINNVSGRAAIVLLLLSLACTPANVVFGFRQALTLRKALGLYAFLYASLHLLNFVGLDYGFDLGFIAQDALLDKPYILAGSLALLILLPLAITSTRGWMKRLGRNWKRLHQLVYGAGVLAVLHFFWQAKVAERWEPLLYGLALALLLTVRVPPVRRWIARTRTTLTKRQAPASQAKVERMTRGLRGQLTVRAWVAKKPVFKNSVSGCWLIRLRGTREEGLLYCDDGSRVLRNEATPGSEFASALGLAPVVQG